MATMNSFTNVAANSTRISKPNQNIQVYVRVRPMNAREHGIRSAEVIEVHPPKEIITRHIADSKLTKKFTFDRTFGPDSKQHEVYETVVGPLIEEVLSGYNCTVFAYGQTGTGKTHTMVGTECAELKSSWDDVSEIGIIPRALSHLFDELRMMELEFSMRISYLELYNEELCDLLSSEDSTKIRIYDDSTKKGSVIIQGLEEIPVHSKDDVYKLLEKGKERRRTAQTLMNAQSSRSHTVFSILVHIKENGIDGEEMLKTGKLNLVDLAGSENVSKAGNEKGIRTRETVNINQSLLTLGRVITALVERTPHIPYRESKLTRLLQESLGGRTKTSIIATISPGHKDLEETLSTLEYAHRAKNIQNRPEVNQKLTKKTVLKEYTEEIDKLKRDLMAARDKNGIYLATETYNDMTYKLDSQNRELNEKMLMLKVLKDELASKEKIFNEVSLHLVEKAEELIKKDKDLSKTQGELQLTKKVLSTTMRRYKEKKVILDCHRKTEEQLLNQASKLIEVADIATSDTFKLHNTIERRRDIDHKIQSACEQFTNRMKSSFNLMGENLTTLQKDHTSHLDLINDEFSNSKKIQNTFLTNAMGKVESISNIYQKSFESFTECLVKHLTSMSTRNTDHKAFVLDVLAILRVKEDELKVNLQQRLNELQQTFDQQRTSVEKANENITHQIVESHKIISKHTEELKERLQGMAETSKISFETEIEKLNANMESKKALATRRQNALAEFMKQMQQMDEEDQNLTQAVTSVTGNLETSKQQIRKSIDEELSNADDFCKKRHQMLGDIQKLCHNFKEDASQNLDECAAIKHSVDTEQVAIHQDIQERLQNLQQSIEKNCEDISSSLSSHRTEFEGIREESASKLSNECQVVRQLMKDENSRLKKQDMQNIALTNSLQKNVKDYACVYNEQVKRCIEDINTFRESETKPYIPSGQTPSKRDFSYPRVLASTSPHNQIIKRYRQETDCSDLDMTINEETEIAAILTDPDVILNSTPIEMNNSSDEKILIKDSNNKIREGSYLPSLKVPTNNRSKPSSRKNSPVIGPARKENKENVF
ncbi:kinesin-like protein Klp61F [Episyrphus balteatus]|uniref:kinesin-like protein Klp61F n=1 Tax=Episyrphus balteatus TaxID=286459 RepID=UPI002486B0A0|nr:kinesin-like protein Klp61F [Episyrphus balteatus]